LYPHINLERRPLSLTLLYKESSVGTSQVSPQYKAYLSFQALELQVLTSH